jgi:hypothetical protein
MDGMIKAVEDPAIAPAKLIKVSTFGTATALG